MIEKEHGSSPSAGSDGKNRKKRLVLAAALLGFCLFSWAAILWHQSTWPAAIAVAAEAAVVAVFCWWLLRKD
jgi:ABC-type Fe3+-siderophore transport system permease subunit